MGAREPLAESAGGGHGHGGWGRCERHERHDVDDAEPWVDADMVREIEITESDVDEPPGRGLGPAGVGSRDGEHTAVMVGITVHVEQRRAGGRADGVDDPAVLAFRHVHHRLQHAVRVGGAAGKPDRVRSPS